MVYQPMLELLTCLRAKGFKTFDRISHVGRLDKGLDEAQAKGWTVVSMKTDWKTIYSNHF